MSPPHPPAAGGHVGGFAETVRTDRWWAGPALTVAVFATFIVYTTWAAFQGEHYFADPYLSPFYSPVLFTELSAPGSAPLAHAWFGAWPSWWPAFLPVSPALFILVFPGSFRFTCYYYRKAYYRSVGGSPPGCGVGPLPKFKYGGETTLFLFQNLHRYALYFALLFIPLLYWDAFQAFFRDGEFGVGVGSIVLLVNASLLAGYTFGCHSLRHLVGGREDCMSCGKNTLQLGAWKKVSWFNARHMAFAWFSLFWVMLTDVYVRLVSMGVITDLNTWTNKL